MRCAHGAYTLVERHVSYTASKDTTRTLVKKDYLSNGDNPKGDNPLASDDHRDT
jgi:hypothetical protein